ncbi:MAG TPA: HlyC/CorC family transporter [Saprospiraceae bacterium]|nr:HlyC/CorC family transporter [Saprospiraceae bacterium]
MMIAIAILMLVLSAMFSGSEIAFVSASKLKMELKKKDGSFRGKLIDKFYHNPAEFIGSLLVGNNVVLVIFTYVMTRGLTPLIKPYIANDFVIFILVTLFLTFIVLIFGEFLPKTIFRVQADRLLFMLAVPLRFFQGLFLLPSKFMNWITRFVLTKVLKISEKREINVFTRNDLEYLVKFGNGTQQEENVQQEMFENALYLQDVKVKVVMVPRTEIVYIDKDATENELIEVFKESGFSRIVVVKETLDDVIGYVHHIKLMEKFEKVEDIVLPIIIVPETLRVHDLLNRLILRKQAIACVVDEYGSVSGLVTLEDVLEEIFGEITDEHDDEENLAKQISENEFLFIGRVEIDKINKKFDAIHIPEGDYNTLSGYIVTTTHSIPEQGEEIQLGRNKFIIEQVSDKKIERVRVIVSNQDDD